MTCQRKTRQNQRNSGQGVGAFIHVMRTPTRSSSSNLNPNMLELRTNLNTMLINVHARTSMAASLRRRSEARRCGRLNEYGPFVPLVASGGCENPRWRGREMGGQLVSRAVQHTARHSMGTRAGSKRFSAILPTLSLVSLSLSTCRAGS